MTPRLVGGKRGLSTAGRPVINNMVLSPRRMAASSPRLRRAWAVAKVSPCKSMVTSGATSPLERRLSQLPSRVSRGGWGRDGAGRGGAIGAGSRAGRIALASSARISSGTGWSSGSSLPGMGRAVRATRAQIACSSGLSRRALTAGFGPLPARLCLWAKANRPRLGPSCRRQSALPQRLHPKTYQNGSGL
jgi:hypothetical protein